jgi:hypothetical protein
MVSSDPFPVLFLLAMGFFFAPNHYGVVSEITKKLLNEINTQ